MYRFQGIRPNPPAEYKDKGITNGPEKPDYQGVIFADGTVAIRWLTQFRSWSVWASFPEFYEVHGHPEYGTVIEWLDSPKELCSCRTVDPESFDGPDEECELHGNPKVLRQLR